ncbi:MAG TPA: hypothetical protein VGF13_21755 [Verrucomicrobiae bacterium]
MPEATLTATPITAESAVQVAPYCVKFFGSPEEVCRRLRDAILKARTAQDFSQTYMDTICGFGSTLTQTQVVLPRCADFEQAPSKKMSSLVFSLAAFPLGLSLDEVLPIALTDDDRKDIAQQMRASNSRAVRAAGGDRPVTEIPLHEQAEVFVLSKILAEIDALTVTRSGD